jgi:hypothetical protein
MFHNFLTFHVKEKMFIFILFTSCKKYMKKKIITNYLFLIMLTRN